MPHQEKATCWNVPHPENDHILENVTSWRMSHPGLYKSWGQTNLRYSHPFEEKKITRKIYKNGRLMSTPPAENQTIKTNCSQTGIFPMS